MAENSLSKSTLICAVHALIEKFPSFVFYFPSYEIFLDELRYVCVYTTVHVCGVLFKNIILIKPYSNRISLYFFHGVK